jgi:hypothetical protein
VSEVIVVGKVESIETKDVKVGPTTYRIAVVRVNDPIKGLKTEKTIRVGFIPVSKPNSIRGYRPLQLEADQEGLFLLKKLDKETFYTTAGPVGFFFPKGRDTDFDKEVQTAKATLKVLKNPQAFLKAKNTDERFLAATLLITEYRVWRGANAKEEPIDAEQSKQILQILAEADWTVVRSYTSLGVTPLYLFTRLGITKGDGFVSPPGGNYGKAAHTWLHENAQKYRIKKFVAVEK